MEGGIVICGERVNNLRYVDDYDHNCWNRRRGGNVRGEDRQREQEIRITVNRRRNVL